MLTLLHVPPERPSVSVVVLPWHTVSVPPMAGGVALMVSVAVLVQPDSEVYVITGLPDPDVVTMPVAEPTAATAGLLLTHVPPDGVAVSVVVTPAHILSVPLMAGAGFTVTVVVAAQPVLASV